MIQTAFAIGNSVAVTIPKRMGVTPGTKFRYKPTVSHRLTYELVEKPSKVSDLEKIREEVRKNSGGLKLEMSTKEFMKIKKYCHDNPYEEI